MHRASLHSHQGQRSPVQSSGGIILPESFRQRSNGGIITRPGHDDGFIEDDQSGIMHPSQRSIYIPQRHYSFPAGMSFATKGVLKNTFTPASASQPVSDAQLEKPRNFSVEAQDLDHGSFKDHDFINRLREAVVDDINRERKGMGLPTLEEARHTKRASYPEAGTFDPEKVMAAVRAMGGGPRGPKH